MSRWKFFGGYLGLKLDSPTVLSEIGALESVWFDFVNEGLSDERNAEAEDAFEILTPERGISVEELIAGIRRALDGDARDIGWAGEALAIDFEQRRLAEAGLPELARRVCKIPDHQGVGYDILSFEGLPKIEDVKKHIEVKTTRSHQPLRTLSFKLTNNEWGTAKALKDAYYVFRIMVSHESVKTMVLRNLWGLYDSGKITLRPQDGWVISFEEEQGEWIQVIDNSALIGQNN